MPSASGQPTLLQGLEHAGQRALGDPGFDRQVPGLLVTPNPQHEQHSERGPRQVLVCENLALHMIPDDVRGTVDIRDRRHRGEVKWLIADSGADIQLGPHEVACAIGGKST